jgi:acyl-CoA thioesterase-1
MTLFQSALEGEERRPFMHERVAAAALRAGKTLLLCLAVVGSLLTFPSGIPWMVALWLLWHTTARLRERSGWMPLAICAAVLLVKGLPWSIGTFAVLLMVVLTLVATALVNSQSSYRRTRVAAVSIGALWLAWGVMAFEWRAAAHTSRKVRLITSRPVVFIGDSLTAGVPPHGGVVPYVRKSLAVPVVDLSQAGITSTEALRKLPEVIAAQPQAVVIEIGGHDFLHGRSRAETRANLEKFILAALEAGAEPILMEVPRGFMIDPYFGVERDLARQYDLELISDTAVRELVLWSPHAPPGMWTGGPYLSQDGLHPNRRGNEHLAQAAIAALVRVFGPEILANDYR